MATKRVFDITKVVESRNFSHRTKLGSIAHNKQRSERTKNGEDAFVTDADELINERQRELRRRLGAVRRVAGAVALVH